MHTIAKKLAVLGLVPQDRAEFLDEVAWQKERRAMLDNAVRASRRTALDEDAIVLERRHHRTLARERVAKVG